MKPIRIFDEDGLSILTSLLQSTDTPPRPTPGNLELLAAALRESGTSSDPAELSRRAGLGDRVRLVAPDDRDDWFDLEVVLPAEADVDADRISLFTPVGMAVLGRRVGETIAWEAPAGLRRMIVADVSKCSRFATSATP